MNEEPVIQLRSGVRILLQNPDPWLITLEDIAHALSNLCRFTGHSSSFYSVAQHSVMVCQMAQDAGADIGTQQSALMHDAAEAYLGDVSSPLKSLLPAYRELEGIWEDAIAHRFGISREPHSIIKTFDSRAVIGEAYALLSPPTGTGWPDVEVDLNAPALTPWAPRRAFEAFIQEARRVDIG